MMFCCHQVLKDQKLDVFITVKMVIKKNVNQYKNLLKGNNKNFRKKCVNCSELTKKTPEQPHWHRDIKKCWRCSGVFTINFEKIPHLWCCYFFITFLNLFVFPMLYLVIKLMKTIASLLHWFAIKPFQTDVNLTGRSTRHVP